MGAGAVAEQENPMEEVKRRIIAGAKVAQSWLLSAWKAFYRWLNRHWFGLTVGLILGAWLF